MTVRLTMLSVSAVVAGILERVCVRVWCCVDGWCRCKCDGRLFRRVLSLVMMKWRTSSSVSCLSCLALDRRLMHVRAAREIKWLVLLHFKTR